MERNDPHAVAIGKAARGALAAAGKNIRSAAPLLDMSTNSLSRRINGTLPFTWPELVKVSELTGTPIHELAATAERIFKDAA